jgi:hypothetical protein
MISRYFLPASSVERPPPQADSELESNVIKVIEKIVFFKILPTNFWMTSLIDHALHYTAGSEGEEFRFFPRIQ